jgi:hypothetical protein
MRKPYVPRQPILAKQRRENSLKLQIKNETSSGSFDSSSSGKPGLGPRSDLMTTTAPSTRYTVVALKTKELGVERSQS